MSSPRVAQVGLRSPRGWLFLAFLGVWLYLASQLLRLYPGRVAAVVVIPVLEVKEVLALTSGLGQLLFFGGLVAALWRANLAAGASNAGIRGLSCGVAGGAILAVFGCPRRRMSSNNCNDASRGPMASSESPVTRMSSVGSLRRAGTNWWISCGSSRLAPRAASPS